MAKKLRRQILDEAPQPALFHPPRDDALEGSQVAKMVGKMRWGDSAELDDDGDFDMSAALPASEVSPFAITAFSHAHPCGHLWTQTLTRTPPLHQPRQVIGPDANGVKTYIDYKVKDDGLKVRDRTPRARPNPSLWRRPTFSIFRSPTKMREKSSLTIRRSPPSFLSRCER